MTGMTEQEFWSLIEQVTPLDIPNDIGTEADEDDVNAVLAQLAAKPDEDVIAFFNMFSNKLHALDTPAHYAACRVSGQEASADVFLYARCHVLVLGEAKYSEVLNNPAAFPPDLWFEDVLSLANQAYDAVYENDPNPDDTPSYESFSNPLWRQ